MIKFGKLIIGLLLIGSLALVLSYCSSSSDSGTSNTGTASAGAAATASTGAIQSATMGLSATAGVSPEAPSFRKAKNLREAVNGFYSGLRARRANTGALEAKFMTAAAPYSAQTMTTTDCATSGTVKTVIVTPDILTAVTNTTMTITYDNCVESNNTMSRVQNGVLTFVDNELSFTLSMGTTATPYTIKTTRLLDNAVVQDDATTMTFTGTLDPDSVISCSTGTEYEHVTIEMNGNMRLRGIDIDNVAYDEHLAVSAYTLDANSTIDFSTCEATSGTIAESGGLSYTDNLDPTRTASMNIPHTDPLNLSWIGGPTGDTYSISGTVTMAASCFTGTLTLETLSDIFIPLNGDCPTAGEVAVTGTVSGSVVYTATGGVQVKDNTGAVVETYAHCDEAQACQL